MHSHDFELIMALAEGTLDDDSAASARANIADCETCSRDLAMQELAVAALAEMPEATLNEIESARLRRNVREAVSMAPQAKLEAAPRRSRLPIAALGAAAAVLLVVVIVGPALNLIGDADSLDQTIGPRAAAASTTAAAAAESLDRPQAEPDLAGDAGGAFGRAPTTDAKATTAAPAEDFLSSRTEDATEFAFFDERQDLRSLLESARENNFEPDEARARVLGASEQSSFDDQLDDAAACINVTVSSEDNFETGFQIARGVVDGVDVLYIVYLAEDPTESELILHDAGNCGILDRTGS